MLNRIITLPLSLSNRQLLWLDQLVFSGTSFLTSLLVARALGAVAFGQFSTVMLVLFLLLGINQALVTGPFQVLHARHDSPGKYTRQVFALQLILTSFLLGLSVVVVFGLLADTASFVKGNMLLLVGLAAGFLWQDFLRKALLILQQPRTALWIDGITGLLQIAALFLWQIRGALTLPVTWWIMALTYIPSVTVGTWKLLASTHGRYFSTDSCQLHWREGKWLLLSALLQWWSGNMIIASAGLLIGVEALGAFRLAQTIFGVFNIGLQVFDNHAVPQATSLLIQSQQSCVTYLRRLQQQTMRWSMPVLLVLFFAAKPLLTAVGGESYASYGYTVQGLCVVYFFIFIGYPIRIAIRSLLMNKAFFQAYAISFLFTLLLVPYLIRHWQLNGILLALTLNQLLLYTYWYWCLHRKAFFLWK